MHTFSSSSVKCSCALTNNLRSLLLISPYIDLFTGSSELKRKLEETFCPEEVKKKRIDGDVPADLITNIVATITEPEQMVGPDVSLSNTDRFFM